MDHQACVLPLLPLLSVLLCVLLQGMVQTLEQYAFIYKAIVDDLTTRTGQQQQQDGQEAEAGSQVAESNASS